MREEFERAQERAKRAYASGGGGQEVAALLAGAVDDILRGLWRQAFEGGPSPPGAALVALGGYGRSELAPWSDIDLLLVHRGWSRDDVERLNRAVLYPLWDAGREVGQRVRQPREVLGMLDHLEEATAALDARLVAGDPRLFLELEASIAGKLRRRRAGLLRQVAEASAERHRRFGHAGHLLEPNLRDSAGGLRDVQTLLWASKLLGPGGLGGLEAQGYLTPPDRRSLEEAWSFLLRARIGLHLQAGRRQDALYLPSQDELAASLGYRLGGGMAAGDAFMRDLYRHARAVDAVVQSTWERILHPLHRRLRRPALHALGDGCVLRDGRLEVVAAVPPADDPAGWLRVFGHAVRARAPVARSSLNWLQSMLSSGPPPRWTEGARRAFVDLLRAGAEASGALEAMDATGLLAALIPEWEPLRCCPQRNLYHRFTVDQHSFATVAELVASRACPEPDVADAWSFVQDDEPLLWAGLLHDVGKGRGGDHVTIGEELARAAVRRAGLSERQVEDVAFLVREHLLLANLATRRDLTQPRTVGEAARRAGDVRRLAMLFLLTRADSLATGPEAWSAHRAALVRELYARARRFLERGLPPPPELARRRVAEVAGLLGWAAEEVEAAVAAMPEGWLAGVDPASAARQLALARDPLGPDEVRTAVAPAEGADELVVVAPDRPGLFAAISGVLAFRSVNVLAARAATRSDGVAVDVFWVTGVHGELAPERWESIRRDLEAALRGELDVGRALASAPDRPRPRAPVGPARVVVVDNEASEAFTVVEVHAPDRLGLLHTVTRALTEAGCDIHVAKVATYGAWVVDVFYVRDLSGRRIDHPEAVARLQQSVLEALGSARRGGPA